MGRTKSILLACLMIAVVGSGASAAGSRVWVDDTGKHEIEAEFIQAKSGWVQLKKPDGELVSLPLEKLSKLDQAHIARLLKQDDADVTAENKEPPKTGRFKTSFEHNSPLTTVEQILTRTMPPSAAAAEANKVRARLGGRLDVYPYDVSKETWEVYVPPDYDGSVPYGIFAFINSSDEGAPKNGWPEVLKKHRLIWVGPNNAGNKKDPVTRRIPLAVEAVYNLTLQYNIDPTRVYISGNSGGGRAASWAAFAYADVFTGGQFHVGCFPYRLLKLPDGKPFVGPVHIPSADLFKKAQQQHRYTFITGDKDFNKDEMKVTHESFLKDGFRYSNYFQIPGGKHGAPPAEWFEKGIIALDAPLLESAPAAFEQAKQFGEREQWGAALLAYGRAAAHGADQDFAAEAKAQASSLRERYNEYIADIGQLIEMGEKQAAIKEIAKLRKDWGDVAATDAKRLAEELRVN